MPQSILDNSWCDKAVVCSQVQHSSVNRIRKKNEERREYLRVRETNRRLGEERGGGGGGWDEEPALTRSPGFLLSSFFPLLYASSPCLDASCVLGRRLRTIYTERYHGIRVPWHRNFQARSLLALKLTQNPLSEVQCIYPPSRRPGEDRTGRHDPSYFFLSLYRRFSFRLISLLVSSLDALLSFCRSSFYLAALLSFLLFFRDLNSWGSSHNVSSTKHIFKSSFSTYTAMLSQGTSRGHEIFL